MRVLLTGAAGQLATSMRKALEGEEVIAFSHKDLDICDARRVREAVQALHPDVVINTAAFRRPDACETDPEKAFAVNALGTRNLALSCSEASSTLVQISSDSVFDGDKTTPYGEEDCPHPINVYGISKLAGELFVRSVAEKFYIVRTSGLFGETGNSGVDTNFVLSVLRQARECGEVRVVTDQYISPTYTVDLATKVVQLIKTNAYGLYHITNQGECSWYEFAQTMFEMTGTQARLVPTTTVSLGGRARRPRYTVLEQGALQRLGLGDLPLWKNALSRYLGELGYAG